METQPLSADEDASLLKLWLDGYDRDALGQALGRHADVVYRVAKRMLGNASDAEDAVQTAYVHAIAQARGFDRRSTVRSWLIGIVINVCRKKLRWSTVRRAHLERVRSELTKSAPPEVNAEAAAALESALAELPDHERLPVLLHAVEDMSFADIAAALSRSENTVRSQARRGLERLREAFGRKGLATATLMGAVTALNAQNAPATLTGTLKPLFVTAKVPAVGAMGALAAAKASLAIAFAAIVTAGSLAVIKSRPEAAGNPPAAVAGAPAVVDPLDRLVDVRWHHRNVMRCLSDLFEDSVDPPFLFTCNSELPSDSYAEIWWYGVSFSQNGISVRAALDEMAKQLHLTWAESTWRNHRVINVWRKLDVDKRNELISRMRSTDPTKDANPAIYAMVSAARELAESYEPESLKAVLEACAHPEPIVRKAAMEAYQGGFTTSRMTTSIPPIAQLAGDEEAQEAIVGTIERAQPNELPRLLKECGWLLNARGIALVRGILEGSLHGGPREENLAEYGLGALSLNDSTQAVDAVMAVARDSTVKSKLRGLALLAASLCADPRCLPFIAQQLGDQDINQETLEWFFSNRFERPTRIRHEPLAEVYLKIFNRNLSPNVNVAALSGLSAYDPAGAAAGFVAIAEDPTGEQNSRGLAVYYYAKTLKGEALPKLRAWSQDNSFTWHNTAREMVDEFERKASPIEKAELDRRDQEKAVADLENLIGSFANRDKSDGRLTFDQGAQILQSCPLVVDAVIVATGEEQPIERRVAASAILGLVHDKQATDTALRLESDSSGEVRAAAIQSLGAMPIDSCRDRLRDLALGDPDEQVRLEAIIAQGDQRFSNLIFRSNIGDVNFSALLQVFEQESSSNLRVEALRQMTWVQMRGGLPKPFPLLTIASKAISGDRDEAVRITAAHALMDILARRGNFDDVADPEFRAMVCDPLLQAIASDPQSVVRHAAIHALRSQDLGTLPEKVIERLRVLAVSETQPFLKAAMEKIAGKEQDISKPPVIDQGADDF
jgi:RNA polymerase sigma-70 factor (ECF subfamily)